MQEAILSIRDEVIIRPATEWDISSILPLLLEWTEESPFKSFGKSDNKRNPKAGVWVAEMIRYQLFMVAEYEEKVIGGISIREHTYPWDDQTKVLCADFLMVLKDYRETGAGMKLIKALKDIADSAGLPATLGMNMAVDIEKKNRLMRMNGFVLTGNNYLYGGQ
jgi:predicted N-acetyltransferase YhbS